jgi:hypothetical protein
MGYGVLLALLMRTQAASLAELAISADDMTNMPPSFAIVIGAALQEV